MPAPAARITPTPSACLPAPGSASSGPAGSPARPTTPPDTEPQPPSPNELLANLPPEVDTGGVIGSPRAPAPAGTPRRRPWSAAGRTARPPGPPRPPAPP